MYIINSAVQPTGLGEENRSLGDWLLIAGVALGALYMLATEKHYGRGDMYIVKYKGEEYWYLPKNIKEVKARAKRDAASDPGWYSAVKAAKLRRA